MIEQAMKYWPVIVFFIATLSGGVKVKYDIESNLIKISDIDKRLRDIEAKAIRYEAYMDYRRRERERR